MNMKYVLKKSLGWIIIITPIALIISIIPGLMVTLGMILAIAMIIAWGVTLVVDV